MQIRLKDGSYTQDPRLDFISYKDERSRNYAARALLADDAEPRNRGYRVGKWLDQGWDGACVGFAYAHELAATPVRAKNWEEVVTYKFAKEDIYWEAQKIDPWPGGAYPGAYPFYEGTSMLAGVKIVQAMGYIDEYRWAFSEEELALAVGHLGPAIIGINWYEGMFTPNRHRFIEPTGRIMGGHAIMVQKINLDKHESYGVWNSWGKDWGFNGWAWISREHMAKLLSENGEACIPLKRNR